MCTPTTNKLFLEVSCHVITSRTAARTVEAGSRVYMTELLIIHSEVKLERYAYAHAQPAHVTYSLQVLRAVHMYVHSKLVSA